MRFTSLLAAVIFYAPLWSIAQAQIRVVPVSGENDAPRASLALSPAVIMVRCNPGQSTTQTLTIMNHTADELRFNLVTEDVVVRDGKRSFSPAGQIPNGIAASSVATPSSVVVAAGEEASVQVTLTLPPETGQRAVVTFFRSGIVAPVAGAVGLTASLGALITFTLSSDYQVEAGPLRATPQTPAANLILSGELRNRGSEPVIASGVVAILDEAGKRVGKAPFPSQRLLPGEQLTFAATNPARLASGHYRALSSFEFEGKVLTSAGEFTIPE